MIRLPSSMHVTYEVNYDFLIFLASTYSKSWMIPNTMLLSKIMIRSSVATDSIDDVLMERTFVS